MGTKKATTSRPNLALLYVRVSTSQQAVSGLGQEAQEAALRAAASLAGFDVEVVVEDGGRSGKALRNRPALRSALDRLARGEAAALYVAKMDRLARNTRETLSVADEADKAGWRLVALDTNLDTGTPVGRLVMTVLAAVAEMERERISERHREAHAARRARGIVWGKDSGPRAVLPADVRGRILTAHEDGQSLRTIAAALTSEGVPTARGGAWHASTVAHVLRSPSLLAA
jgi:DNA invertase Pin-like site-specific DNA recombinase